MFYLTFDNLENRTAVISKLKEYNISSFFHYLSLHKSEFYIDKHDGRILKNSDKFTDCLLRLPLFYELETEQVNMITDLI